MSRFTKDKDIISDNPDKSLFIDVEELNDELAESGLKYRKWNKLKAEASKQVKAIKQKLKETEAQATLAYALEGGKVAEVEAKVELDDEVIKLREELIEAEYTLEDFIGIMQSMFMRHESIKELCANKRKELIDQEFTWTFKQRQKNKQKI